LLAIGKRKNDDWSLAVINVLDHSSELGVQVFLYLVNLAAAMVVCLIQNFNHIAPVLRQVLLEMFTACLIKVILTTDFSVRMILLLHHYDAFSPKGL
jgi:hypothetical protein